MFGSPSMYIFVGVMYEFECFYFFVILKLFYLPQEMGTEPAVLKIENFKL